MPCTNTDSAVKDPTAGLGEASRCLACRAARFVVLYGVYRIPRLCLQTVKLVDAVLDGDISLARRGTAVSRLD